MPNKAQDDDLVMNLVELALARPPEDRERYLHSACAHDSQLFEEVRKYVEWEERMNGFLLEPLYPSPSNKLTLEPGELLDGRFRIVREVAQGGMGIVYEAVDEKLERRIAIKCAKPGFRKRLPPEVRHATEISHPNVCKIFEIHTASTDRGEIDFLTMEFLEGETLAERLRRGPLPEAQARAIAQQLSAGLAAAHRNQVIHGDLKSNNVILTTAADGSIRAVITDFGLARRPETTQETVRTGALGGTPDYMAPELWKGEKATAASDIYALGVILYELASGRAPFRLSPEVSWEERLSPRPPAVNPKWDRVLTRCLEVDPARRFRSAQEVGQALAPRSRRWMLAAAAAVVLAAVSGLVTYQRATAPPETVRLAVLPFQAAPETAPIAEAIFRDTATQVSHLKGSSRIGLKVIPQAAVLRNQVNSLEKAKTVIHATHVLRGSIQRQDHNVTLNAFLTDARSGVNVKEWKVIYGPGEVRYAGVALAGMVTGTLHLPPLVAQLAVNATARQDYLSGLADLRRDSSIDAALASFEKAVAADPDSPLTHAALAEAQWIKYYFTQDKSWLERTTESVRQAEGRNPDVAEVYRAAGLLDANAGRYDLAIGEYLRAIELQPGNGVAYRRLGKTYESNNQLDQAVAALQKAIEVQPGDYRSHQDLGAFHFQRANYGEAVKHFAKAVELAPDEPNTHFALASTQMNLGFFAGAESQLRLARGLKETPAVLHTLGQVLMYQKRDAEAIPFFLRTLEISPDWFPYLNWMHLATCYQRTNHPTEAAQANQRGLQSAQHEMTNNPRSGYVRSYLAYLSATNGDRQKAESEIAQALELSPNDADTLWAAALAYEALGRRDQALEVLSSAPTGMLSNLSRWPDAAGLQSDSRFTNLLLSRGIK